MAEVAGLVIGGVGLLSLFDSCMSAFNCVDAGREYGKDYQRTALQISLLQLRLSRWKASVDIRENVDGLGDKVQVANEAEVKKVRKLLGHIYDDLETAEEKSKKYELENPPSPETGTEAATLDSLSARVRKISLRQQKSSSLRQKTRWALHDSKKFANLVSELEGNITSLVTLFPATAAKQTQLAQTELEEIIQPSEIEQPEEAASILRETSEGIDAQLVAAIERAAAAAEGGYRFNRMGLDENAQALFGTYYAPGQYQKGHKGHASFNDIVARGNTRAHFGDNIGGEYVLGGGFHQQVHGDASAGAHRGGQQVRRYDGRGGYAETFGGRGR